MLRLETQSLWPEIKQSLCGTGDSVLYQNPHRVSDWEFSRCLWVCFTYHLNYEVHLYERAPGEGSKSLFHAF